MEGLEAQKKEKRKNKEAKRRKMEKLLKTKEREKEDIGIKIASYTYWLKFNLFEAQPSVRSLIGFLR